VVCANGFRLVLHCGLLAGAGVGGCPGAGTLAGPRGVAM